MAEDKKKESKESLSGIPYLKKEANRLAQIPGEIASAIPGVIESMAENPKQTLTGIPVGLASLLDLPAVGYNAATYPFKKYAAYKYGEENVGHPKDEDSIFPFSLPYFSHEVATDIADSITGSPKNESERKARLGGELASVLFQPGTAFTKGIPEIERLLKKGIEEFPTPDRHATKKYTPFDLGKAEETKNAAQQLGFHLTPAEASGEPFLAAKQGAQGYTKEGAKDLYEFQQGRGKKLDRLIEDNLENISTGSTIKVSPDADLQVAAKNIIGKKEKALQKEAAPYYEQAAKKLVGKRVPDKEVKVVSSILDAYGEPIVTTKLEPTKEIKWPKAIAEDPAIIRSINKVWNDPQYYVDLEGFKKNSIRVLDLAKRDIDSRIAKNKSITAPNKDAVRVLTASKKRLTSIMDQLSPIYKKARSIYEEGSPAIEALKNGTIGKIATRKDITIKNIGKDIFDHAQTNPKIFKEIRDQIYKESPEAWKNIVRQEMERKIGTTESGASNFYKKILKDNKTYRQFHEALSHNKGAQKNLALMKKTFGNLIESVSVKSAAEKGVNLSTNKTVQVLNAIAEKVGVKFDKAAIDLILDPRWNERMRKVEKITDLDDRVTQFTRLMAEAAVGATKASVKAVKKGSPVASIEGAIAQDRNINQSDNIEEPSEYPEYDNLSLEELKSLDTRLYGKPKTDEDKEFEAEDKEFGYLTDDEVVRLHSKLYGNNNNDLTY